MEYPQNPIDSSESIIINKLYFMLKSSDESLSFSVGRNPLGQTSLNKKDYVAFVKTTDNPSVLTHYDIDGAALTYQPAILGTTSGYVQLGYGHGFKNNNLKYKYSEYATLPINLQAAYGVSPLYKADVFAVSVVPINTESIKLWLNYVNGKNIYSAPTDSKLFAYDGNSG